MGLLTPMQEWLTDYLAALGMSSTELVYTIVSLWEPEATDEMLRFIGETLENDPAKLSKKACEIGRKYQRDWEDIDEEETLDETETARDL